MNNQTLDVLRSRRSIKSYEARQIDESLLCEILEAATFAPTGKNSQSPTIVVVQNKEEIAQLSKMNAEILGVNSDPFYGAPTVAIILGNPEYFTWMEDACLVAGNLMNAAHAVGIGSCWIHRAKQMFESEAGKQLLKKWDLNENLIGVANIILGYQQGEPKPRVARKSDYIKRIN